MAELLTNLFPHIANFAALRVAALNAVSGKRRKPGAAAFMANLEKNVQRRLPEANVRRFRNRLRGLRDRWQAGTVEAETVQQHVQAWIAHAGHADTWRLRQTLFGGGWFDPSLKPDDPPVGRVLRGGSWNNNPRNTRAANRNNNTPTNRNNNVGFRLASTLSMCQSRFLQGEGGCA